MGFSIQEDSSHKAKCKSEFENNQVENPIFNQENVFRSQNKLFILHTHLS